MERSEDKPMLGRSLADGSSFRSTDTEVLAASGGSNHAVFALVLGAVLYVAFLWSRTLYLPFFSDSYSHLDMTSGFTGILDSFDLDLMPLRPLQHAWFYVLQGMDNVHPGLARLPLFAMHLLACPLLWFSMKELGCSRNSRVIAIVAFLAFPTVKSLVWVAAVGWSGRLVATLLTLWLFLRHDRQPSFATGIGQVIAFLIALGFHQSAVMIPIWLVLLLAMRENFAPRPTLTRILHKLRDPWFLSMLLVATSFAVYVAFFRDVRYHGVTVRSIPASGARALFSLAPEFIRQPCVEGLRGHSGVWGYALGGAASLVLCIGLLLLLWRGSALVRFLVLAIGIEFSLPIVSTGFSQRYAYVAAALAAVLLAMWLWSPGRRRWKIATLLVLCCAWTYDQFTDLAEFRAAGAHSAQLVEQLIEAGPRGAPDTPVTVINAPYVAGAEKDIPVFNYGMRQSLRRGGSTNSWVLLNTERIRFGTDFRSIREEDLNRLLDGNEGPVLEYDTKTKRYRRIR